MRTRAAHLALAVHEAAVNRMVPSALAEGHGKQLVDEARKMLVARQEAFEPTKRENPSQGPSTSEVEADESSPKSAPREEVRQFEEPYRVFKTSNGVAHCWARGRLLMIIPTPDSHILCKACDH